MSSVYFGKMIAEHHHKASKLTKKANFHEERAIFLDRTHKLLCEIFQQMVHEAVQGVSGTLNDPTMARKIGNLIGANAEYEVREGRKKLGRDVS